MLSFVSTLYLYPVLDELVQEVPAIWQPEVRLGLQEALVNAAKHGNNLDPSKKISVRFATVEDCCWWIITDQGGGFQHPYCCEETSQDGCLHTLEECGRGLFILYKIFDNVCWRQGGRELHLCKRVRSWMRQPLIC